MQEIRIEIPNPTEEFFWKLKDAMKSPQPVDLNIKIRIHTVETKHVGCDPSIATLKTYIGGLAVAVNVLGVEGKAIQAGG